jgi:hypothetical protein
VLVYRFPTIVPTLVRVGVAAAVWRRLLSRAPASARDVSGAEVVVKDDGSGEEIR